MPTQQEIEDAYEVVFANEKEQAVALIGVLDEFVTNLNALYAQLAPLAANSVIGQNVNQVRSSTFMYAALINNLKTAYSIVEE